MSALVKSFRRGDPMIWFTGSALGICILMIAGLIAVILVNGLSFFWPQPLTAGDPQGRQPVPGRGRRPASPSPTPATPTTSRNTGSSSGSATATSSGSTSSGSTRTTS